MVDHIWSTYCVGAGKKEARSILSRKWQLRLAVNLKIGCASSVGSKFS
jgi:hypothetical protein